MIIADRPRRSALYLPASNARAIEKACSLPADVVILDLEDAVAPDLKASARNAAVNAVNAGLFGKREVIIRANALDTQWGAEDIKAIALSRANGVLVPKISSPADIDRYQTALSAAPQTMALWAMIETCASIGAINAIAARSATTRLAAFVIGTNDLAKEMRARLTPERTVFLPMLSLTVAAARAHNIVVMDGVCNEFHDLTIFEAEAEQGLIFGFDGKTLIHPKQVDPCNAIFSPSAEELAWARAVIDAFALPENVGKGAIRVNGKMAELLHLDEARRLVKIAEGLDLPA